MSLPAEPSSAASNPAAQFRDGFDVVVAGTPELREATFALRHEVYSRELGFEPPHPSGLERDEYDDRAWHYLLAHRPSRAWAGCVRVIPADPTGAGFGLPFERAGAPLPDDAWGRLAAVPRSSLGEISRLTVARAFRGQRPLLVGLALVAIAAAAGNGLRSVVCLMQPQLVERLRPHGIRFEQLSEPFDYHGSRAVFHLSPQATQRELGPELSGLLAAIQAQTASGRATEAECR